MKSSASGKNAGNEAYNKKAQQECYERFISMFESKGYSDKFEFIGGHTSSKGKVILRCKICGSEFEKIGSFVQQGINIRCNKCHAHLNDIISAPMDGLLEAHVLAEFREGKSVKKISKQYGIHERYISEILKESGVDVKNEYIKRVQDGTYSQSHTPKDYDAWYIARFGRTAEEVKRDQDERIKQHQIEKDERREIAMRKRGEGGLVSVLKAIAKAKRRQEQYIEMYSPRQSTCKYCGKEWTFYPSAERYGRTIPPAYCSKKCRIHANRHGKNISHRLKIYGRGSEHRDTIKLKDLYERDGGRCYICGESVEWNDCKTDTNGNFICGGKYPTIDHVVPLSMGGRHTWDNVRLAHHMCNCIKGTKEIEEAKK